MSNLYGSSYQDSFQPTFSPAARDENRRPFLDLNQPLTAMGRRQPNHIQTPAPNLYLPQPTFSPTYDPATQNFHVASHQEPAALRRHYVSDTFCETPLARGDWDFSSPPVSEPSTCGSFPGQYHNSAEGSVEWQAYEIPCEDQLAYDAFGQPHYSAVNLLPYHSQHTPISPTQHSSYSELSANSSSIVSRAGQTKGSVGATPTERKIACGRPNEDEPDQTCAQCLRRDLTCEYPKESRRGQHKRGPKGKAGHR
ncbi:uncharacterized protein LACBIDRAFT_333101 [Laccaria bicolor S238N-H82]|uniref:Predicted protein n=1 Tax=Laccaria bicolor (strain S238N-H82 / ATCC MYA-4686) TaxID=486041 RepID=B0DUV7_LACBS|nr:uncharacterized protein LACBIDRAFT_333101 [Laccaria bicolor S238N-H82]EDR01679.1 predicted protein [Laccaria bicolor S238N-H82]|eukprot:XP_001887755.1 predicted protein [Laccaria bicolor S238N-H82]